MTVKRDGGWLGDGPALFTIDELSLASRRQRGTLCGMDEDATIELVFSAEQIALIDSVAAARGCLVSEFILQEALARARQVLGSAGLQANLSALDIDLIG